ncbi:RNA-directed DNA polymerase, eukaryota [Tanacetum coccineum]
MSIRGVFIDGDWKIDPDVVKDVFKDHFAARFKQPANGRLKLNIPFTNRLSTEQAADMDRCVSRDEIRDIGGLLVQIFVLLLNVFFDNGTFPKGSNSSFIALIPKVMDAKFVTDFRPISLIGCVYKVITKILANRLATVISDLVSDIQSAFVANRQILDGPFILNELLACSAMASILVNGSPTSEFLFFYGLKQGDPLAPYLFILIMESLHISFSRATNDMLFKGVMVGDCMSQKLAWAETVQKLHSRLSNWKVKMQSIGGRLTLLKSVLGASPLYNMLIYKVPKGVLNEMEAIRSKIFSGADTLERKIIHLSLWCFILREMHLLKSKGFDFVTHCKKRVGDGHCTRFWYDNWFSDQPFRVTFPRLFALETDKDSTDRWICNLNGDGEFRVKDVRIKLDDILFPSDSNATRWVKYIPIKIIVFAWCVRLNRLSTRSNLIRRRVVLESLLCPMCGLIPEDIHHVIFRCDIAQFIFRRICCWWDMAWHDLFSFSDWNQTIFAETSSRRSVIFDDIVSRSFN